MNRVTRPCTRYSCVTDQGSYILSSTFELYILYKKSCNVFTVNCKLYIGFLNRCFYVAASRACLSEIPGPHLAGGRCVP